MKCSRDVSGRVGFQSFVENTKQETQEEAEREREREMFLDSFK